MRFSSFREWQPLLFPSTSLAIHTPHCTVILAKDLVKSKTSDGEPEAVSIAVSMRKSHGRTLRTPPFEAAPEQHRADQRRALDIQFSFRYLHSFRDSADVLVVRLQRATRKKRRSTIALAPIYLADVLQVPLDDDITLSAKKDKGWVSCAKIHVQMGTYPEHVTSLDDAQDWEFGLLPEGQNVGSDDDEFEDDDAIPTGAAITTTAAVIPPVPSTLTAAGAKRAPVAVGSAQSPVIMSTSAPDVSFVARLAGKSHQQPGDKAKKKKPSKLKTSTSPKGGKRTGYQIDHDEFKHSSSSSDDDDDLPPSYSEAGIQAGVAAAAGTTLAAAAAAAPVGSGGSSLMLGVPASGPVGFSLPASQAGQQAEGHRAASQESEEVEMQRLIDAYEKLTRGYGRIVMFDGQKRRSRKIADIGERPRFRESGTCAVCTRTPREVVALMTMLFERRDETTRVAIAGSDRYVNDVIRPFLELAVTKPLNSEPVLFYVLPIGKASEIALHVASQDAEYR
jgi:hypothetical protein